MCCQDKSYSSSVLIFRNIQQLDATKWIRRSINKNKELETKLWIIILIVKYLFHFNNEHLEWFWTDARLTRIFQHRVQKVRLRNPNPTGNSDRDWNFHEERNIVRPLQKLGFASGADSLFQFFFLSKLEISEKRFSEFFVPTRGNHFSVILNNIQKCYYKNINFYL